MIYKKVFKDNLAVVATSSKTSGQSTINVNNGSEFTGVVSASSVMPLDVFASGNPISLGRVLASGISGNTLTVGTGVSISAGNTLACVPSADEMNEIYGWLPVPSSGDSGKILLATNSGYILSTDPLSSYMTSTAVASGYYSKATIDSQLLGKANATTVNAIDGRLSVVESNYVNSSGVATAIATREPVISASDSTKYYRGDKTWQSLSTAVIASLPSQTGNTNKVLGTDGTNLSWVGGSAGVTSVALSVPAGLSVSGSPVTSSGTLAVTTSLSGIVKGTGSGFTTATPSTDYLIPSDLSSYATTSALSSGLSSKADSSTVYSKTASDAKYALITTTDSLDSRIDVLEAAPKSITAIARWVLASDAALTSGDAVDERASVPVGYTITHVTVNAQSNGGSGGFTFNIAVDGTNIFSSAQTYSASTTTTSSYNSFSNSSISALDQIALNIVSVGSDVKNVVVELWGRES